MRTNRLSHVHLQNRLLQTEAVKLLDKLEEAACPARTIMQPFTVDLHFREIARLDQCGETGAAIGSNEY